MRNRLDGSVEALFAGPEESVEEMVRVCHDGSRAARVTAVRRFDATPDDMPGEGFRQLPTE